MQSFSEIIERLGGSTKAAQVLGTTQQNAWQMADRNSIPPKYWTTIVDALDGVSFEDLARLAAERGESPPSPTAGTD